MNININYLTNLIDFVVMQRTSFCWFISEGIAEELKWFSRIYNFNKNIEYILFGEEYSLVKPPCPSEKARRWDASYRTELIIPMECRSEIENEIICERKFSIISLPLMSVSSTFILNGCERVIVSQIIRSPGVYFEKQKVAKKFPFFKRKLSTEIGKLRSFLPAGEAFISDCDFLFTQKQLWVKNIPRNTTKDQVWKTVTERPYWGLVNSSFDFVQQPAWNKNGIRSFSITALKRKENNFSFSFLENFKFYQTVLKEIRTFQKQKLILFLIKWLKKIVYRKNSTLKNISIPILLDYFNLLLVFSFKYHLILKTNKLPNTLLNNLKLGRSLSEFYFSALMDIQKSIQIELNINLVLILYTWISWNCKLKNFYFLKNNIINLVKTIQNHKELTESNQLKPVIYFSKTLKDQLKYTFSESKTLKILLSESESNPRKFEANPRSRSLLSSELEKTYYNPKSHHYFKYKSELLLFSEDHHVKTAYQSKYQSDEKELYSATLIPEYGSWIRFKFQKQTKNSAYHYPVRYEREDLTIQLDRINSIFILTFLKEIGFNDMSIYHNLEQSDFFYSSTPLVTYDNRINKPSLMFNYHSSTISDVSKIFNPVFYRLGKIGRIQLNKKLNLNLSQRLQTITYEDVFGIVDKLITLTVIFSLPDDIDHLKNKRVRSAGELLQNLLRIGFQRLERQFLNKNKFEINMVNVIIQEFFGSSQLSQYLDQTNPLSSLTHRRRISGLGPGGLDRERISFAIRDIHPSHYGRICPIETPEGKNVGLVSSLTTCGRVNQFGFLETPFWRVVNGKILKIGKPIYLTSDMEDLYKIAPPDVTINEYNYIIQHNTPARYRQDFLTVMPFEIDFISISPVQIVSIATALIPFFEHDDANRSLMGSNMQRQAVPLMLPQKPIVGTGFENQIATDSGMSMNSTNSGMIEKVEANKIILKSKNGEQICYTLRKYMRSNQQTCIHQRPIVWVGETVQSGQMLSDGPSISMNELSLGQNVLVSYMPWQGYNFEDAILISERLVYDNLFSSIHIERYKVEFDETAESVEKVTKDIPNLTISQLKNLDWDGIVEVGTYVRPGEILVGKVIKTRSPNQSPEMRLLRAIFGAKSNGIKDNSYRMPNGHHGRMIEKLIFNKRRNETIEFEKIYLFIAQIKKIQIGDKLAGRHGNKGIVSRILSRQDMPFLPDGTSVDIILNPLGVPSRMNVGQIYECLLGIVGQKLNCRFKILPFDESYGIEISRILINKKLRHVSIFKNESWLYNPYSPGKMVLIDGRTGKEFDNPITVGNAYMLKLIHLVDDKMHSRSTGPYSLVTQQPLRGKAQQGGQRFGEMEVWALEGFGAAFTLKELLTIKSDDIEGRNNLVIAIIKRKQIPKLGVPESFKVLMQELRSLGLDMQTYVMKKFSSSENSLVEINLIEKYNAVSKFFDPDSNTNIKDIKF